MSTNAVPPHGLLQTPSRVRFDAECAIIPIDTPTGPRGRPRLCTRTVSIPLPINWVNGLHRPIIQFDHQDPHLPCAHKNPSFTLKLPRVTRRPDSHASFPPPSTKSCLRSPSLDRGSSPPTIGPVLPSDLLPSSESTLESPIPFSPPPESTSSFTSGSPSAHSSPSSYFSPRPLFRRSSTSNQPNTVPLRPCCSKCLLGLSRAMSHDRVEWSPAAWRKKMIDEEEERAGNASGWSNLMVKVDEVESGKVNGNGTRTTESVESVESVEPDRDRELEEAINAVGSWNASGVDLLGKEPAPSPPVDVVGEKTPECDAVDSPRLPELHALSIPSEPNGLRPWVPESSGQETQQLPNLYLIGGFFVADQQWWTRHAADRIDFDLLSKGRRTRPTNAPPLCTHTPPYSRIYRLLRAHRRDVSRGSPFLEDRALSTDAVTSWVRTRAHHVTPFFLPTKSRDTPCTCFSRLFSSAIFFGSWSSAPLKRDVAGISDTSLLSTEADGFEETVRRATRGAVCVSVLGATSGHPRHVELGEKRMAEVVKTFWIRMKQSEIVVQDVSATSPTLLLQHSQ
ncbi:hypothetical protein BS47DRAFT_1485376 [Hydnum rufescens UP504]|uniref:Uncharacterized protein n=1 Tax=Hydnum rufescens UP504 TaxID=1448309 RepID=A0A9P6AXN9_9AGAM|nr:hypothetical protein BS47DRAFT_1485376 [Hydnum rufescens UP504]